MSKPSTPPPSPDATTETADPRWRELYRLFRIAFPGLKRRMFLLTALAFIGALIEAGIVLMIATLGSALIDGRGRLDRTDLGLHVSISTSQLAILLLIAAVVRGLADLVLIEFRSRTEASYERTARRRVVRLYLAADWDLQSEERSGGMQALLVGFITHARGLLQQTIATVVAATSLLIMLGASFAVGKVATLATVLFMAIAALGLRSFVRHSRLAAMQSRDATVRFSDRISETIAMALEIRTLGATAAVDGQLTSEIDELATAQYRSSNAQYRLQTTHTALTFVAVALGMLVLAAFKVGDPRPYAAMLLLLYRAMVYGRGVQTGYQAIVSAQPYLEELQRRLHQYRDAAEERGVLEAGRSEQLVIDDVSFSYGGKWAALENVTFALESRESLGVVGPSGAGKSTLIQLLLGLRHPHAGQILLNGVDLRQIAPRALSRHIGYVPQEARLFDSSILDNVICHRPWITKDDAVLAVRAAYVFDDVMAMPAGLDTSVGVGGRRLSGGQRQRVCIARALAGKPELLILDEPTSALDLASEEAIRLTLEGLRGDMALVIIAHRLSTLRVCDRILVLRDGRVDALGERSDVETNNPYYAEATRLNSLA